MLSRRELLKAGAVAGAPLVLGGTTALAGGRPSKRIRPEPLIRDGRFTLGVSAGQPRTDGAILWTRVDGIERSGRVTMEIARDAEFKNVVQRGTTRAASVRDYCVRQNVTGLPAGQEFFYRFHTRTADSPVGRLRTLRPADSREPTRIGFFSCQKYRAGFYTAHAGLAAEDDLDLVVCLGDYIYEERESATEPRRDTTGKNGDGEVQSLAEFQAKYQLYKADPMLQAMHAAHPYVAIWDDHEAENDYAGENSGDIVDRRIPFAARRRNGYEAFFQYHPVARDWQDRSRIYRSVNLGGAEVFLTDQRQYRDKLACEPVTPCPQGSRPGRSILGREQRDWLVDALRRSQAPWKLLGSSVMFAGLDLPPGVQLNADQWDGYADERRIVGEQLLAAGVQDITTMTGDIHTFFAGQVTTTGRIGGRPFATEFVGGSITSGGINETLAGAGVPQGGGPLTPTTLLAANPHLAYAETESKGYGILEARPDELLATFRSPSTILRPEATVGDLARFRVARGSTTIERL
ncbi:MAG: alkaline phosphatase D family protein [Solirubrobacterales bacterium]|nr:alkaline phosphatase D family protein [Solirubrobacterales bacterium]